MHYFISDLHLGHANILKYDQRPFATIEEHDRTLIENINNTVGNGDTLWILGDVAWSQAAFNNLWCLQRGDFTIEFLKGNHDVARITESGEWPDVVYRNDFKRGAPPIFMSHYPHLSWPNSFHGSLHLYGHVHGNIKGVGRSMDVGANMIGYKPISLDQVIEKLSDIKPHSV